MQISSTVSHSSGRAGAARSPASACGVVLPLGGASRSRVRFPRRRETQHRVVGNVLIAIGAVLPGIGGTATRLGHTEVLYVTEFVGLALIWAGYRWNVRAPVVIAGPVQAAPAT